MEFTIDASGQVTVVTVRVTKLDAANAKEFKTDFTPILEKYQKIVLNLGSLSFIDSSGLGALLSCLRQANSRQGDIKLCTLTKSVRILFELVRMHKVFEIFNTREDAVASFVS